MGQLIYENILTLGGSIDFFKETVLSILAVPQYHDYFHESVILQFLVAPIPRFLWLEKPASEMIWFYTLFRWKVDIFATGGNILPGIVGQFYMSWGWWGIILIGFFLGYVTGKIDLIFFGKNNTNNIYFRALGILFLVWVFISFRLISPGLLYPIIIFGISVIMSRYKSRAFPRYSMPRSQRKFLRGDK